MAYRFLGRKKTKLNKYDRTTQEPVIRASICNGEQVAGFQDLHTGAFEEVMLIRSAKDLSSFKEEYGISTDLDTIY